MWGWERFMSRVNNSMNFWITVAVPTFGIDQNQPFSCLDQLAENRTDL